MIKQFIGRKQEQNVLNNNYEKSSSLIMINGANQIGKTELIKKFIEDKPAFYFSAAEVTDELNRELFLKVIQDNYPDMINPNETPLSWENLLKAITANNQDKKILIIDNFDNLVQGNSGFIPEFLKIWQNILKPNNVTTVIALPNNSVLINMQKQNNNFMKAINLRLNLKPIPFFELLHYFPNKPLAELVSIYNITGGFPLYWDYFIDSQSIMEQFKLVNNLMTQPSGFFYDLPLSLLQKSVWDTTSYMTILYYIAHGVDNFNELLKKTRLKKSQLLKYLANLEILGYVESEKSILEKRNNYKRNKFYISNPFLRFWFYYVYPNRSSLDARTLERDILETYPDYIEKTFKNISKELLQAAVTQKTIDFNIDRIGSFWNNKEASIPIVAIDDQNKQIFLADTQFSLKDYDINSFIDFFKSTLNLKELKKFRDYKKIYGLFTANNPPEEIVNYALNNENTLVFSGTKLFKKKN